MALGFRWSVSVDGVVLPQGPGDAGHLVGKSDGGVVVSSELLGTQCPDSESIGLAVSFGGPEDGTSSVNEEHAEVSVSPLADGSDAPFESGGSFSGSEPEIAGEVTARGEASDVADEGDESGGGEQSDARDGAQAPDDRVLACQELELPFDGSDALFEVADLETGFRESEAKRVRECDIGVLDELESSGNDVPCAERDDESELAENATDGVDAGGPVGEPGGAESMQCSEGLLVDALDGNGLDPRIADGFEEGVSVSAIGLVAVDVGCDVLRWEQYHVMSELPKLSPPVVCGTTGLHDDGGGLSLGEEAEQLGA